MIQLTVVGSGTVAPSAARTAAAHWVTTDQVRMLLDCGAGTAHRLAQFELPWHRVTHIAITHFHVDHWGELPHLLFALRWGVLPPRSDRLYLIGPVGFRQRLENLAAVLGDWVCAPGYPLSVVELAPGTSYQLTDDTTLEAFSTPHTEESQAYAIRSGSARLVYTGDTGQSDSLADWARGCNLLLCECSLPDSAGIDMHLTPSQAGRLAARAAATRLVLTHFYPPVEGTDPAGIAATVFSGEVVAANDGDSFIIDE